MPRFDTALYLAWLSFRRIHDPCPDGSSSWYSNVLGFKGDGLNLSTEALSFFLKLNVLAGVFE